MKNVRFKGLLLLIIAVSMAPATALSQEPFWRRTNLAADFSLNLSADNLGNVFACTTAGPFRTRDGGITWDPIDSGLGNCGDQLITYMIADPSGALMAWNWYGLLTRSSNQGETWSVINHSDLYRIDAALFYNGHLYAGGSLDCCPDCANAFYSPSAAAIQSPDSGTTWTTLYSIDPPDCGTNVTSVLRDRAGSLFMGVRGRGLFRSMDDGTHWEQSGSMTFKTIRSLGLDSSNGILAGTDQGIFRSHDNGIRWNRIGLDTVTILSMLVDPAGTIYAGSNGNGVFRSQTNGRIWESVSSGLTEFVISSMAITTDGVLFAAAYGGGVYRSLGSVTGVVTANGHLPVEYELDQNIPNPFNPTTSIAFSIPVPTHVRIQVFTVLGQRLQTLVDEYKQPGKYRVTWDAANLPSGFYLYQLTAGDFVKTRKAVVLR